MCRSFVNRDRFVLIAFLSFSSPLAFSQGTFPLHIGDTWKYWWMNTSGHIGQTSTKITSTVALNGLTYYALPQESWPFTYLRHSGDTLKTFTSDSTGEVTVFHRWMNVGDSLDWGRPNSPEPTRAVVTAIDTLPAMFGDTLTLHMRWTIGIVRTGESYRSTVFWVIEDSLGIVEWAEGWLTGSWGGLYAAEIAGQTYGPMTSVLMSDRSVPRTPIVLAAYPNPFNSQTTASITTSKSGVLRVTLHDLLGRELQVLRSGSVAPGTIIFSVSLSGHSSGVYVLRASVDEHGVATRLMLVK